MTGAGSGEQPESCCGFCEEDEETFQKRRERFEKKAKEWKERTEYNEDYIGGSDSCSTCLGYFCCIPCCCVGTYSYCLFGSVNTILECTGDVGDEKHDYSCYKAFAKCAYVCMWCPGHFAQTTFCGCICPDERPGHPPNPLGYGFDEPRDFEGVSKFIYQETLPTLPNPCEDEMEEALEDFQECCCEGCLCFEIVKILRCKKPKITLCCLLRICG